MGMLNKMTIGFILSPGFRTADVIETEAIFRFHPRNKIFIVGSTGLLEGKEATTNYHQIIDLPKIGVRPSGKKVAEDGKYFSAGPVVGSYQVGLKAVEKIISKEWAQYIAHEVLEFAPNPLFGTNPQTASKSIFFVTHSTISQLRRLYHPAIRKGYYGQGVKPDLQMKRVVS